MSVTSGGAYRAGGPRPPHKWFGKTERIIALVALVVIGLSLATVVGAFNGHHKPSNTAATTTPAPTPTVTVTAVASASPSVKVDVVTKALGQEGFKPHTYVVAPQKVDTKSAAKATTGTGRYAKKYITTPADAVAFLASGTPAANAALAAGEKQTGSTRQQLLDSSNWVVVQFTGTSVQWNGNSAFLGSITDKTSSRVDQPGTVGVFFVPPNQVKAGKVTSLFVLRGACGNVQYQMPTPPGQPAQAVCSLQATPGYKVVNCEVVKDPSQNTFYCQQNGTFNSVDPSTGKTCPPNLVDRPVGQDPEPSEPEPGASVSTRPSAQPTVIRSSGDPAPSPTSGGYNGGSHSPTPAPTPTQVSSSPIGGDPGCGCGG